MVVSPHVWRRLNDALHDQIVDGLPQNGALPVALTPQPYLRADYSVNEPVGYHSNWSQRHVAYAAGLGTCGLPESFITERGSAHHCGSVVTDVRVPVSLRTSSWATRHVPVLPERELQEVREPLPDGSHQRDWIRQDQVPGYTHGTLVHLVKQYGARVPGCGLCQTDTPCESRNPRARERAPVARNAALTCWNSLQP
jgi:epoxyqueuosine reductase